MKPSPRGLYRKDDIIDLGLPMFYDFKCQNGDDMFLMDYWTYTEFKELLDIKLTDEERAFDNIKAFTSGPGYFGWAPLYSMSEILNNRGMRVKYSPPGE